MARLEQSFRCGTRRRHRTLDRLLLSSALLTSFGMVLSGCSSITGDGATTSMPSQAEVLTESNAVPPSDKPADTAQGSALVPVYWLGKNGGSVQLYREFLPAEPEGDPIAAAVRAMTGTAPLDPDYFGHWQPAESVSSSISPGNIITVDISSDAFESQIDEGAAYRTVQQLIYTATAAAANSGLIASGDPSSVVVLVDGMAGYTAFGHIELGEEMRRDTTLIAPVWIINPQAGEARDQSTVTVQGAGVSDDSALHWRVDQIGADERTMYRSGTVQLEEGSGSARSFEFTIALLPGEYEITVFDRPPESEESAELNADTKEIEIREG